MPCNGLKFGTTSVSCVSLPIRFVVRHRPKNVMMACNGDSYSGTKRGGGRKGKERRLREKADKVKNHVKERGKEREMRDGTRGKREYATQRVVVE